MKNKLIECFLFPKKSTVFFFLHSQWYWYKNSEQKQSLSLKIDGKYLQVSSRDPYLMDFGNISWINVYSLFGKYSVSLMNLEIFGWRTLLHWVGYNPFAKLPVVIISGWTLCKILLGVDPFKQSFLFILSSPNQIIHF